MLKQINTFIALGATAIITLSASNSYSQDSTLESCSSSDIQDGIDQAAADLSCNADGAYISPQSIGAALFDKCGDKPKEACRKCMALNIEGIKRGYSTFVRLGVLEQSSLPALRTTLSYLLKNGCGSGSTEQPGDGDQPDNGDGTSPPSPTPPTPPTPGATLSPAEIAAAILKECPCPTTPEQLNRFSGCVGNQSHLLIEKATEAAMKEALSSIRVTCNLPSGDK